ncbi:signal-regulatory protein beta-1-like [Symphalangus syndactylus]|uniref:signal-regulatory protein beta-1-like n=1 Tax=Symphalangus syndactylus TaxID=9590 RepID=UPI003007B99B
MRRVLDSPEQSSFMVLSRGHGMGLWGVTHDTSLGCGKHAESKHIRTPLLHHLGLSEALLNISLIPTMRTNQAAVAKPSAPVVSGPAARTMPEHTVSFTCESHGFSSRDITLKWFKNGNEISDFQTNVDPAGESVSYSIHSTARVVLTRGDVHSQVICEVAHVTLQGDPLRGTANLSEAIQVSPTLEVTQQPIRAENQANVTCQVRKFYPQRLQLTWVGNGNVSWTETASTLTENKVTVNKDGTYNWMSWLLVNTCAHRDDVVLTCQVEHDGQQAVSKSYALEISVHQKEQRSDITHGLALAPTAPLLVALLLGPKVLLVVGVSAVYICWKQNA